MLEKGYKDVKVAGTISFPGNANHEMGTTAWAVIQNFCAQCFQSNGMRCQTYSSPMVKLRLASGFVNPSLTYMALTARARLRGNGNEERKYLVAGYCISHGGRCCHSLVRHNKMRQTLFHQHKLFSSEKTLPHFTQSSMYG